VYGRGWKDFAAGAKNSRAEVDAMRRLAANLATKLVDDDELEGCPNDNEGPSGGLHSDMRSWRDGEQDSDDSRIASG